MRAGRAPCLAEQALRTLAVGIALQVASARPAPACRRSEARRGSFRLERTAQRRLRRGEPRDRHAVGRARDVVEAGLWQKNDRGRIAAVLAADADLELGPRLAAALAADLDQLADALLSSDSNGSFRGCRLPRTPGGTSPRRRARAERRLRQVVGAEREELRRLGDLVGASGGARQLDHRADEVLDFSPAFRDDLRRRPASTMAFIRSSSFSVATSGIMISGIDVDAVLLRTLARGLEDRAHLHLVDLRDT